MKKLKFIMNKGLPASGKSTWAKEYLAANSNTVRINNDSLQLQMFGVAFSMEKGAQDLLADVRVGMIEMAMLHGKNIIVDNTNLDPKMEKLYRNMVDEWNATAIGGPEVAQGPFYEFIVKDFTHVPVGECLKRNRLRVDAVPEKVIYQMYDKWLKPKNPVVLKQDESLPSAIIVDLDGTLALMGDRGPYEQYRVYEDTVNPGVFPIVSSFMQNPFCQVIFATGREEDCRSETVRWLKDKCGFDSDNYLLYMKADKDSRKDTVTKAEIFNEKIKGKYNVLFCLDDRWRVTQMWRELGLTCLQVEDGFY